MDLEAVFEARKSTRRFTGQAVDQAIIKKGVAYGQKAPSAGAMRAYRWLAVTEKKTIERLAGLACQRWIETAGLVVVIGIDPERSARRYKERGRSLYCIQDATLFGAYLDLYFVSQGLGTCWVGAFREERVKQLLSLDYRPISLLVVGHPRISRN